MTGHVTKSLRGTPACQQAGRGHPALEDARDDSLLDPGRYRAPDRPMLIDAPKLPIPTARAASVSAGPEVPVPQRTSSSPARGFLWCRCAAWSPRLASSVGVVMPHTARRGLATWLPLLRVPDRACKPRGFPGRLRLRCLPGPGHRRRTGGPRGRRCRRARTAHRCRAHRLTARDVEHEPGERQTKGGPHAPGHVEHARGHT